MPIDSEPSREEPGNIGQFRQALEALLHRASMEINSETPDFILATYLTACLKAFDGAVTARDRWHGFRPQRSGEEDSDG